MVVTASDGATTADRTVWIPEHTVYAEDLAAGDLAQLGLCPVEHAQVLEFAGHWDD